MREAMYIGDNPDILGEYGWFDDEPTKTGHDGTFILLVPSGDGEMSRSYGVYLDELRFVEDDEEEEFDEEEFEDDEYYGYWDDDFDDEDDF